MDRAWFTGKPEVMLQGWQIAPDERAYVPAVHMFNRALMSIGAIPTCRIEANLPRFHQSAGYVVSPEITGKIYRSALIKHMPTSD